MKYISAGRSTTEVENYMLLTCYYAARMLDAGEHAFPV